MDLTSLVGMILGVIFIITGIMGQGVLSDYFDLPSIFIVLGGTFASTIIKHSFEDIKNIGKIALIAFKKNRYNLHEPISKIIELANIARKSGLFALEERVNGMKDPFLKKGLMLVVDGTDPELIRNIMETELVYIEERHKRGSDMFNSMATFAPAYGMIGTLIGLISMLKNLNDASTLGLGMATAIITTFYGVILANLIFSPIAGKLKNMTDAELQYKELILEGLLSIQAGENPRMIEEKLLAFISKIQQKKKR